MSALREPQTIQNNCCSLVSLFMNILSHEQSAVKAEFDTIELFAVFCRIFKFF